MELVQGKDLRQLLKRAREQGGAVPIPVALFIAREIALALTYAHSLKDASGKLLKVVHRDVSPHNIVISNSGAVKLHRLRSRARRQQVGATPPAAS